MRVVPAHDDLERRMEISQALVARHEHAPPNRRADFQEEDMKLVDVWRLIFFRHYLSSCSLSLALEYLDAFFQLLATGQGVAHGRGNSRGAIFGLVARIDGDFFQ